MVDKIADGVVVTLAYILTAEGMEVERATADDPLDYLHGAENIVPGLETALAGKKVGDKLAVTLKPEDAYGDYDDEEVEAISWEEIPEGEKIEPGMVLVLEDEDGNMFDALVKETTDDAVILDFNPPLAGKTVTYDVEVLALRAANEEELEHGHPHGEDYEDDDDYYFYDDEDEDEEELEN